MVGRVRAADADGVAAVPLRRNRNYNILWSSQALSELSIEVLAVAFPLLVLASGGSALKAGTTISLAMAAGMLSALPAGLLADRADRKVVMLAAQAGRALAIAGLAAIVVLHGYGFFIAVGFVLVEAAFAALFDPAEHAILGLVVPEAQLATAIARNAVRPYVAALAGPTLAGLAFGLHPAAPFLLVAAALLLSACSIGFLRLPEVPRPLPPPGERSWGADLSEVGRWLASQAAIRNTLAWITAANVLLNALVIITIARAHQDGVPSSQIGLMMASLGVGGLAGGLIASRLTTRVSVATILRAFAVAAAICLVSMSLVQSSWQIAALLAAAVLLAPTATTAVLTFQFTATPDAMRGRVGSLLNLCSGGAVVLGPVLGGALVASCGASRALAACGGAMFLAAAATLMMRFAHK